MFAEDVDPCSETACWWRKHPELRTALTGQDSPQVDAGGAPGVGFDAVVDWPDGESLVLSGTAPSESIAFATVVAQLVPRLWQMTGRPETQRPSLTVSDNGDGTRTASLWVHSGHPMDRGGMASVTFGLRHGDDHGPRTPAADAIAGAGAVPGTAIRGAGFAFLEGATAAEAGDGRLRSGEVLVSENGRYMLRQSDDASASWELVDRRSGAVTWRAADALRTPRDFGNFRLDRRVFGSANRMGDIVISVDGLTFLGTGGGDFTVHSDGNAGDLMSFTISDAGELRFTNLIDREVLWSSHGTPEADWAVIAGELALLARQHRAARR